MSFVLWMSRRILYTYTLNIENTYLIDNMAYLTPCLSITHYVLNEAITVPSIIYESISVTPIDIIKGHTFAAVLVLQTDTQ